MDNANDMFKFTGNVLNKTMVSPVLGDTSARQSTPDSDTNIGIREILPAHTAPLTKDPIGGSTNAQVDWANQVNPLREIGVGRAVYLGGKGIDAAVSYGIGKAADAIALPSNEK